MKTLLAVLLVGMAGQAMAQENWLTKLSREYDAKHEPKVVAVPVAPLPRIVKSEYMRTSSGVLLFVTIYSDYSMQIRIGDGETFWVR